MKITKEKKLELKSTVSNLVKLIKANKKDNVAINDLVSIIFKLSKPIVAKFYKDQNDRQEVLNYIATKIINKIELIDDQKSICNYIQTTANNYCIDEYRRLTRKKGKIVYTDTDTLDLMPKINNDTFMGYHDCIDMYLICTQNNIEHANLMYSVLHEDIPLETLSKNYNITKENIQVIVDKGTKILYTLLKEEKKKLLKSCS